MSSRALDRRRSAAWRTRAPLEPAQIERIGYAADPALEVDRARVRAALDALPEDQRNVVELAYLHGLSSSEIAERTAIPIGTVKSRTAAAMGRLRTELLGGRR
jgi:RNA polymerase sigma-70 factor (ECF subfamily)